jgi:hypothetical protein
MTEPEYIETVLATLRAAFHTKRRERISVIEQISTALASYANAVDVAVTRDLCKAHGLKAPAEGDPPVRWAEELRRLVDSLPEIRQSLSNAVSEPKATAAERKSVAEPAPGSKRPRRSPAEPVSNAATPGNLTELASRIQMAPLVIVGGQPHLERLGALPAALLGSIEWIDTTRQGTHAIGNLEHRIRDHRILGLIILEGLVQHRHSDPLISAARSVGLPHAFGGKGGRAAMQQALDEVESKLKRFAQQG